MKNFFDKNFSDRKFLNKVNLKQKTFLNKIHGVTQFNQQQCCLNPNSTNVYKSSLSEQYEIHRTL